MNSGAPQLKTGAVVVTFNPDQTLGARLAAIRPQVDRLLVVDNSPLETTRAFVSQATKDAGGDCLPQITNNGVAGALNTGFALLHREGFLRALAFDQDSTPSPSLVQVLLGALATRPNAALCSPDWFDEHLPELRAQHLRRHNTLRFLFQRRIITSDTEAPFTASFAILSGSCFALTHWASLGGFDERLMLDLVDQDFCLRANDAGLQTWIIPSARLAHNRGSKQPVLRFGRIWHPAFMSPHRLRCMFHNRTRLFFTWLLKHPHMATYEAAYSLKLLFDVCFLEDRSCAKLYAMSCGAADALLRKPLKL